MSDLEDSSADSDEDGALGLGRGRGKLTFSSILITTAILLRHLQ